MCLPVESDELAKLVKQLPPSNREVLRKLSMLIEAIVSLQDQNNVQ